MLRIHVDEGRLAGPWVHELEQCCRNLKVSDKRLLVINLAAVRYVDHEGQRLLGQLHRSGAALEASGALSRYLVEQIRRNEGGDLPRAI
jgi:hypothetical protein